MQKQQKNIKQSSNLIAHYQTMFDYHRMLMEQYWLKSKQQHENKSPENKLQSRQ